MPTEYEYHEGKKAQEGFEEGMKALCGTRQAFPCASKICFHRAEITATSFSLTNAAISSVT